MTEGARWWAEGLLFENCNCQLLCPAHLSFKQRCAVERCVGHWAFHFEDGRYAGTPLGGLNAFIVTEAPPLMISGDWTQAVYIDERASPAQREALEQIFSGRAGGTWAVLARFVGKRLQTRFVPIGFDDDGRRKRMTIDGLGETAVEALRGADREREATLTNVFNQIHSPTQTLALGTTHYADHGLVMTTAGTHALYSRFAWQGP